MANNILFAEQSKGHCTLITGIILLYGFSISITLSPPISWIAFDKAVKLNTGFIDRLVGGCRLDEDKRELIKDARHEINETRNVQVIKAGK